MGHHAIFASTCAAQMGLAAAGVPLAWRLNGEFA